MRIKLRTEDTNKLLWRDSPCTLRNTLQNITIDRSSRFHLGSIYHQDQINKAKKVFTELEKPELLLLNFRRQISEATARRQSKSTRHPVRSKYISSEGSPMSSAGNTGSKFYKVPQKL